MMTTLVTELYSRGLHRPLRHLNWRHDAVQVAMQQTAVDPTTGTIDMDLIQTGISAGDRVARSHLTTELQALIESALLLGFHVPSHCDVHCHTCLHAV